MRGSRRLWIGLALLVLALAPVADIIGQEGNDFLAQHFRREYEPEDLTPQAIGSFPAEYFIEGVPWISYQKAYCQSASLQMIAYKHGIKESLGYFNFIMGFTYGAFDEGFSKTFMPYTDPETGFKVAAPYLGLKRRYLITNDDTMFLRALRFYLSKGYPVRVAVNAARLYDKKGFFPHSEVLVGYDKEEFSFYETGKKDQLIEASKGISVSNQTLLEAISDINKTFRYPWKFALTIFEKAEKKDDLSPIWTRNGELLIGFKGGPVATGSCAIKEVISYLESLGDKLDKSSIQNSIGFFLECGPYTRADNAAFLRKYFAGDKEAEEAAQLFQKAAECYTKILKSTEGIKGKEDYRSIIELLRECASLEENR